MIKSIFNISASLSLLIIFILALSANVQGSSFHATGNMKELNPVDGRDRDRGHCLFYTGPHGDFLQENEFLLFLTDDELEDSFELELTGTFEMDGERRFNLFPDEDTAEGLLEAILSEQLGGESVDISINRFRATVVYPRNALFPKDIGDEESINCRIRIKGRLMVGEEDSRRFRLTFNGPGLHFVDFHGEFEEEQPPAETASSSLSTRGQGSCPIPNFTPNNEFCIPKSCLVDFAGYKWWTLYHYDPNNGYYYNGGLQTIFAPQNVSVDSEGLHLKITRQNLGGGTEWTGAEAVVVQNADGSQANLGFGTYLVSARIKSAASFSQMDPNVALGLFTYQKDKSNDQNNPYRELDLAEISRWGNAPGTPIAQCTASPKTLCEGNSQFAVQIWNKSPDNVRRYTIAEGVNEITLVMEWTAANSPVTFRQYNGLFTLETLPQTPDNVFTTSADQNRFIPDSDCQRFHMNYWMGNFARAVSGLNPGPSNGQPQEVVITNFQYEPIN